MRNRLVTIAAAGSLGFACLVSAAGARGDG